MSDDDLADPSIWQARLIGKLYIKPEDAAAASADSNVFKKEDLPETHRVVPHGYLMTADFRPERLTVILDEQGKCAQCYFS